MPKIKIVLPIILVATAALFTIASAFTSHKQVPSARFSETWFEYLGDINGNGYANPQNYQQSNPSCSSGTTNLCKIFVLSDGGSTPQPDATALSSMQTEINNAVGSAETSDVKLRN